MSPIALLEQLTSNRYPQAGHVAKVRRAQIAVNMLSRKENLLVGTVQNPPELDLTLQTAQLPVGKAAGILALKVLENRR